MLSHVDIQSLVVSIKLQLCVSNYIMKQKGHDRERLRYKEEHWAEAAEVL